MQTHQTYKPISNSAYAGQRLAGSSSNSRLNQAQGGFDMQGKDYRSTMQVPGSSSLNYDETDGKYGAGTAGRFDASRQTSREAAATTIRGRSTDAVQPGQYPYKYGQEKTAGLPAGQAASNIADQLVNGHASHNLYN